MFSFDPNHTKKLAISIGLAGRFIGIKLLLNDKSSLRIDDVFVTPILTTLDNTLEATQFLEILGKISDANLVSE